MEIENLEQANEIQKRMKELEKAKACAFMAACIKMLKGGFAWLR